MKIGWHMQSEGDLMYWDGHFDWYIGRLNGRGLEHVFGTKHDQEFYQRVLKVLKRELPNGYPRKRHASKVVGG